MSITIDETLCRNMRILGDKYLQCSKFLDCPEPISHSVKNFINELSIISWSSNTTRTECLRKLFIAQLGSYECQDEFDEIVAFQTIKQILPIILEKFNLKTHAENCRNVADLKSARIIADDSRRDCRVLYRIFYNDICKYIGDPTATDRLNIAISAAAATRFALAAIREAFREGRYYYGIESLLNRDTIAGYSANAAIFANIANSIVNKSDDVIAYISKNATHIPINDVDGVAVGFPSIFDIDSVIDSAIDSEIDSVVVNDDHILELSARIALEALIELKSPGTKYLYLCDEQLYLLCDE